MKVGILSPRSNAHPAMALEFMEGLRTFLKQQELNDSCRFYNESVDFGGAEKEVYARAEKLLMMDDVDILLGYIDERVLQMLQPLLYASGKLMIVINPGANYPLNWVPQANIIHLTLQHAFCCWLTGSLAAKAADNNAITATTFYDCGYLHAAAIVKAFTNGGGNITFNYVNNDKYDEAFAITALTDFIGRDANAGNALCIFDSLPASLFYNLLNARNEAENMHLYVSPMMLEQTALAYAPGGFKFSIDGYLPWKISAGHEGNKLFTGTYQQNNKEASMFAVLGWEAGMILKQVFDTSAGNYTDGAALVEALKKASMNGPRGLLKLDGETHYFLPAVGRAAIKKGTTTMDMEWVNDYEAEWKRFIEEPTGGVISGWTNTYLCY